MTKVVATWTVVSYEQEEDELHTSHLTLMDNFNGALYYEPFGFADF